MTMRDELDKKIKASEALAREHPTMCGCGTCAEAIDTALSMVLKNKEYQCDLWMLQVAFTIIGITKLRVMNKAMSEGHEQRAAFAVAHNAASEAERVMAGHMSLQLERLNKASKEGD